MLERFLDAAAEINIRRVMVGSVLGFNLFATIYVSALLG
jgi:hypothetical protein